MINKWIDKIFERKCYVISYFSSLHVAEFLLKIKKLCFLSEASIVTADRVQYPIAETLCRPTECNIRLRKHCDGRQSVLFDWSKHYDGRQSALSDWSKHCDGRQSALSGWSKHRDGRQSALSDWRKHSVARQSTLFDWSKHCDGRQSVIFCRSKHCDGRQSVISNRASTLSADRVLLPMRDCLCRKWTWQMTLKMSGLQQKNNASILMIQKNYYLCPR